MPVIRSNGIQLSCRTQGDGEPVLLISPAAAPAALWDRYQVPALIEAGYRVVTFENRGTAPSDIPPGPYRLDDLAADAAGLIETLGLGPCHVMGLSLGAMVAQELTLSRPELVRSVALLATRGRSDAFRDALARSCAELMRDRGEIPLLYNAVATMSQLFGPLTLADNRQADDWLATLMMFPQRREGWAAQYEATLNEDRLAALTGLQRKALVLSFTHDLVMPSAMGRAVADAIPDCQYEEVADCGHFGFLERPTEVNRLIIDFFRGAVR